MKPYKTKSAIKVSNIQSYVENKRIRDTTPFVITPDGESYYLHESRKVNPNTFEKLFHLDLKPLALKGDNSDRTKSWIHGEKSY